MEDVKLVKVVVTETFRDRENNLELREKDLEFDVTEERAKLLVERGLVRVVESKRPEEQQGTPKKRAGKKETESNKK